MAKERKRKAIASNTMYQQFDAMMGLENNKVVEELRDANPLHCY